jgi:hypothetical protein
METADTSAYNAHNLEAYKDVAVPGPLVSGRSSKNSEQ